VINIRARWLVDFFYSLAYVKSREIAMHYVQLLLPL
jgi:hypothetical protein